MDSLIYRQQPSPPPLSADLSTSSSLWTGPIIPLTTSPPPIAQFPTAPQFQLPLIRLIQLLLIYAFPSHSQPIGVSTKPMFGRPAHNNDSSVCFRTELTRLRTRERRAFRSKAKRIRLPQRPAVELTVLFGDNVAAVGLALIHKQHDVKVFLASNMKG